MKIGYDGDETGRPDRSAGRGLRRSGARGGALGRALPSTTCRPSRSIVTPPTCGSASWLFAAALRRDGNSFSG